METRALPQKCNKGIVREVRLELNQRIMMTKIAFLLSVYGNPVQANYFIKQALCYDGSYVFIHIDKKDESLRPEI